MDQIVLLMKAASYAAGKHAAHRRKGVDETPYVNHVAEVAALLAEATGGCDVALIIAGLLHDILEDVPASPRDKEELSAEIAALFGTEVLSIVEEVTDDKSLPDAERKRLQETHAPSKSPRAKMLKIADKTSNIRELVDNPPASWSVERRIAYLEWSRRVVDGCRGVHAGLEAAYDAAYARARAALGD